MAEEINLIKHITDHPWPGCQTQLFGLPVTWMSSGIATMLLAGAILLLVLPMLASRRKLAPGGAYNVVEVLVVFVRDMIARPALHDRAYEFLPFLLTLFVFILAMNLLGMVPLGSAATVLGLPRIGGAATGIPTVTGGLACITLLTVIGSGLKRQAEVCHHKRGWPVALCLAISPVLWTMSLAPKMSGATGVILAGPFMLLELVGVFARCFALMIRLFANMASGHMIAAVLMMFITQAMQAGLVNLALVGPVCVAASVAMNALDLLVSGLQAYIFTFLSAVFIGLYSGDGH